MRWLLWTSLAQSGEPKTDAQRAATAARGRCKTPAGVWSHKRRMPPSGDGGEALGDRAPIDDVPPRVDVVRSAVLVMQVVGVLPDVDAEQRRLAGRYRVVLIGGPDDREARAVVDQPRPAGAELTDAGRLQLGLKIGKRTERRIDR